MRLETIKKIQLADELGLLDPSGETSERGVACLLRASLSRWGLSPKRAVLKYAREQLRAGGVDDVSCIGNVLQRMVALGECDEVYVGFDVYLAPAEPRWVQVGDGAGSYLGVAGPPDGVSEVHTSNHRDIVQRIRINTDDDAALLHVGGAQEVSLADWLTPPEYLRHAARRKRQPVVTSDRVTLEGFWDILEKSLSEEGLALGEDAEVRALTGPPGQFFGRHNAEDLEGRWTVNASQGVWCACRRGFGDTHWHPIILAVNAGDRRALDLYDWDEWRWALLARGRRFGSEEVGQSEPAGCVRLTFPPPAQLHAAMDLLGSPISAWAWEVSQGAPEVWALI